LTRPDFFFNRSMRFYSNLISLTYIPNYMEPLCLASSFDAGRVRPFWKIFQVLI